VLAQHLVRRIFPVVEVAAQLIAQLEAGEHDQRRAGTLRGEAPDIAQHLVVAPRP
jgi:hypothetical protein